MKAGTESPVVAASRQIMPRRGPMIVTARSLVIHSSFPIVCVSAEVVAFSRILTQEPLATPPQRA
jgi:hypothetical protein